MGKMGFIRIATIGKQPLSVVTDAVAAFFDAAMIGVGCRVRRQGHIGGRIGKERHDIGKRSEEHTSELQSLMRISYAVFCLKKKNNKSRHTNSIQTKGNI